MKGRVLAGAACAALAAVAAPAFAQAPPSLTWVAYAQGKPGKTTEWLNLTLKHDAPMYDKLMAAGVVRSWGVATPINHRPGFGWNLLTWVTVDNWAGVDKWAGAAMQTMQARSEQETKAIEASYQAVEEGRSHFDEVVRNAVFVPGKPGAKIAYFLVGHYLARPGQDAALTQLYKEAIVPIADKLVADGVVTSYGLHVQELHGQFQPDRKWTHRSWYAVSDLGAIDRIQAALVAGISPQLGARATEVSDGSAHTDDVLMVLHQAAPPAAPAATKK
jgi:hypothetical protein